MNDESERDGGSVGDWSDPEFLYATEHTGVDPRHTWVWAWKHPLTRIARRKATHVIIIGGIVTHCVVAISEVTLNDWLFLVLAVICELE